jgi:hypothetical protein
VDLEPRVEPVVGWRVWNLSEDGGGPVLWPAGSGADPWPRGRPLEARCTVPRLVSGRRRHAAPDPRCRCGIYAADSPGIVGRERPAWPPAPVLGQVALWGRTIEHERGWRSRYAYPARLRLACPICAWVEPGTGRPAVVHAFTGRLYPLCAEHAGGIEVPDGRRSRATATEPESLQARLLDAYGVDLLPIDRCAPLFSRPPAPELPSYFPAIRMVPRADAEGR